MLHVHTVESVQNLQGGWVSGWRQGEATLPHIMPSLLGECPESQHYGSHPKGGTQRHTCSPLQTLTTRLNIKREGGNGPPPEVQEKQLYRPHLPLEQESLITITSSYVLDQVSLPTHWPATSHPWALDSLPVSLYRTKPDTEDGWPQSQPS